MTGKQLRVACALLGWNYVEMGRYLGLSRFAIAKYAKDQRGIPKSVAYAIQKKLEEEGEAVVNVK